MKRVLILGVGSIGERHLRCFGQTGRCAMSFVEVNAGLRTEMAARYNVATSYASLDDALALGTFDAAVVCTPAPLHVPQARQLVAHGLDVLIEKPLSTTFDGIDALRAEIAQANRTVGVAYVYRVHPLLSAVRDVLHSGRFGVPLEVLVASGQHFPFYRPAYRSIYYARHESGGGAIQDALTHLVNATEWLVGPIDRLVVDADHLALEGVDVEDTVHLLARHGRTMANYGLNQHQAPNELTITVVCERGTVRAEFHASRWRWQTDPAGGWNDEPLPPLERDSLFIAQANAFLDAVEGRRPVPCSLDDGLQTLRVNLAALASWRTQTWQTIARGAS
ncbi:MAG: Gfo/Idh/MocA family oxidoreductase [Pirellulales bacterium]